LVALIQQGFKLAQQALAKLDRIIELLEDLTRERVGR
jgi:hypothetical protein